MIPIPSFDLEFLTTLTAAAVDSARVPAGETISGNGVSKTNNTLGFTAIRPGGRACYPAIWIQDFTMICASGFVTDEEMHAHLHLIASSQYGPVERHLKSGAVIPPYAIPDHINFDGSPVFFPGTYSSGEDQGGDMFGLRPPMNNYYDFIWLAHQLWEKRERDASFLRESISGNTLIKRLLLAFNSPETDPATGLAYTELSRRAVGFIFCDTVYMTGHLLFASLLRWRAAGHLAMLLDAFGDKPTASYLRNEQEKIKKNLGPAFSTPEQTGGWLRASTGLSNQPDVWGTIYALYLGVLDDHRAACARNELHRALYLGTIAFEGAIRHVPLDRDASPTSAWEKSSTPHNRYQNGAYWHMPTGWLISALSERDPEGAHKLFDDMITHLRRESFLNGDAFNAPWECIGWKNTAEQNPVFAPSITVPYSVFRPV